MRNQGGGGKIRDTGTTNQIRKRTEMGLRRDEVGCVERFNACWLTGLIELSFVRCPIFVVLRLLRALFFRGCGDFSSLLSLLLHRGFEIWAWWIRWLCGWRWRCLWKLEIPWATCLLELNWWWRPCMSIFLCDVLVIWYTVSIHDVCYMSEIFWTLYCWILRCLFSMRELRVYNHRQFNICFLTRLHALFPPACLLLPQDVFTLGLQLCFALHCPSGTYGIVCYKRKLSWEVFKRRLAVPLKRNRVQEFPKGKQEIWTMKSFNEGIGGQLTKEGTIDPREKERLTIWERNVHMKKEGTTVHKWRF